MSELIGSGRTVYVGIRILIDAHYKNLVDWKNLHWGLHKLYDKVMELAEKTENE